MSDEMYRAMRAYIDIAVEMRTKEAKNELRALLPTETRVVEPVNGKDGKDGVDGKDGRDGVNGINGKDGKDGIATREELDAWFEQRAADLQMRSLADVYQGVYENGKTYTRGSLATWGGSLFLALADTRLRPEETPDWKLIVKHGRDAKR